MEVIINTPKPVEPTYTLAGLTACQIRIILRGLNDRCTTAADKLSFEIKNKTNVATIYGGGIDE